MTKALLDAQLALFKAQMQYEQASPGKVEVIEELVSKVGKLLEEEKAESAENCCNITPNGTAGGLEQAQQFPNGGERQAAVEKKLEFLRMMSQLQTTRDSLILDNELYDIVGQRVAEKTALLDDLQKQGAVYMSEMMAGLCSGLPYSESTIKELVYHFCAYAGKLPTGPFLELFSELPGDLYGLLEWLQLRPHHAPLLTTLMGIIQSSNRNHQGAQRSKATIMAERSAAHGAPAEGYIKAFVPASDIVHSLLPHALVAEQTVATSEAPMHIPSLTTPANGHLTHSLTAEQGGQAQSPSRPAYRPYSIKPVSVSGGGVIGPASMLTVAPQGVALGKLSPLPAPQMDTPAGVPAQRRVSASVTPVARDVHKAAAAAAEADDSGSDDDFHDPLQGMPQGTDFDEQEQALPDFTLAADVAYFPLSRPSGAPVDTGDLVFTSEHISETDSEDTLPLGESGPVADWPEAQPRNMAQGLTLPAPQVLPQPGPERQPPTRPQSARQEPPVLQQHELPVSGPAMAQQQELKQERLQVTAEEGKQEAVAAAAGPKDGASSDGDASVDNKMKFTQGQGGKGTGKEAGKGRKARMAAAKRAAEARRPVVPGAEPAEDPPVPAGGTTNAQRAELDSRQLEAKPSMPTLEWADEPTDGEHANEAQGFRDDGSSICDSNSYIWPRSEASQDSHFDQDGWGRQAFNDFESRYPTVPKSLLSDAVTTALDIKMRKQDNNRLEQLRQTWTCKKLFAGNLGASINGLSEADLQEAFRKHNCIKAKLCRYQDGSGRHRGYGFLTFDTSENAFQALKEMDRTRPYPLHCRVRLEPVNDPNHPDDPPSPNPSHAPTLSSSRATSQDDMTFYASAVAASKATWGAKHLFMSNVGSCTTEKEVHAAFADYNLVNVRIPQFTDTGRNRNFAFLTFATDEDGYLALQEMNGSRRLSPQHWENGIRLGIDETPQLYREDVSGLETLETRQLYLGNIGVTVTVEDIHTVFRDYNIEEARIPADRDRGGLPRGFAFLTFATPQDALRALREMNQKHFPGTDRTMKLNPDYSFPEPTVVDSLDTRRLYMGNLHESTTEDTICDVFRDFGIEEARVITTSTGVSRGFAFLTFATVQEALRALREMQGKRFPGTGRTIKLNPDSTFVDRGGVDRHRIDSLDSPRLFMGNIDGTLCERDIVNVFSKYNIESARIITDRDGLSKQYGFLTFRTTGDALRALKEMNRELFPGTDRRMRLAPDTDAADGRAPAHARAHDNSTLLAAARSQSPRSRQERAASRVRELYTGGPKKDTEEAKADDFTVSTKSQGRKGATKAATTVKELCETVPNQFAALATDLVED